MAARKVKTSTKGIYKRGSRYVFVYRVDGKRVWETCRTLDEARRAKAARTTDIDRGEFDRRSRVTLREYALDWIERYPGRGRRGFRESTRADYKRILEQYVLEHFGKRVRLSDITPTKVAGYIAWLCDERAQGQKSLGQVRAQLPWPAQRVYGERGARGADPHQPDSGRRPAAPANGR